MATTPCLGCLDDIAEGDGLGHSEVWCTECDKLRYHIHDCDRCMKKALDKLDKVKDKNLTNKTANDKKLLKELKIPTSAIVCLVDHLSDKRGELIRKRLEQEKLFKIENKRPRDGKDEDNTSGNVNVDDTDHDAAEDDAPDYLKILHAFKYVEMVILAGKSCPDGEFILTPSENASALLRLEVQELERKSKKQELRLLLRAMF